MGFFEENILLLYSDFPFFIKVPNYILLILFVKLYLAQFGPWCWAGLLSDPSLFEAAVVICEVGKKAVSASNLVWKEQNPTTHQLKRGLILRSRPLENPRHS